MPIAYVAQIAFSGETTDARRIGSFAILVSMNLQTSVPTRPCGGMPSVVRGRPATRDHDARELLRRLALDRRSTYRPVAAIPVPRLGNPAAV